MKRTAYNEYRKSAKKTAYRSDLLGLHKGWLAFGVELDSFCERSTSPINASISNVGMGSLASSKLYGNATGFCLSGSGCANQATCTDGTTDCDTNITGVQNGGWVGTQNPGKENFIGFPGGVVTANCATSVVNPVGLDINDTATDQHCQLDIAEYKMGVYGHLSGDNFIGTQVDQNGVVSERSEGGYTAAHAETTCV